MRYSIADELQQSKHFLYEIVFLDTYKVILLLHIWEEVVVGGGAP